MSTFLSSKSPVTATIEFCRSDLPRVILPHATRLEVLYLFSSIVRTTRNTIFYAPHSTPQIFTSGLPSTRLTLLNLARALDSLCKPPKASLYSLAKRGLNSCELPVKDVREPPRPARLCPSSLSSPSLTRGACAYMIVSYYLSNKVVKICRI